MACSSSSGEISRAGNRHGRFTFLLLRFRGFHWTGNLREALRMIFRGHCEEVLVSFSRSPVDVQNSTLCKIVQVELSRGTACLHQPGRIIHAELSSGKFIIESAEVFLLHSGEVVAADILLRSVADLVGAVETVATFRYHFLSDESQVKCSSEIIAVLRFAQIKSVSPIRCCESILSSPRLLTYKSFPVG